MKKKVLAILMTAAMCAGLMAGCGASGGDSAGGSSEDSASEEAKQEESVELKMVMIQMGGNMEAADDVEAAVNAYIEPKINATVDITWMDFADYMSQLNLQLSSGEVIDILPTFGSMTSMWYAQDALMSLDDLIADYPGIEEAVGEEYMETGKINGVLYSIPCVRAFSQDRVLTYRVDIAEKYGLDMDSVETLEDLTPIFEKLHEAEPEMWCLISNNPSDPMFSVWDWDGLGDEYGVLMDAENSTEVVDLFETEEYKELVTLMHEWYELGYIQEDASTCTDSSDVLWQTGNTFGCIGNYGPGEAENRSVTVGYELATVQLVDRLATTSTVSNAVMTIPSTAANPEKAMEFINLLYTDGDLLNLLYYGIEGENYQAVDGRAQFLDGEDATTASYVNYMTTGLAIGDATKALGQPNSPDDLNEQIADYNENCNRSTALGFSYDSSTVSNELTALETVCAKYRRGLESGTLDPETDLPKFIEELKAAGIDDVVAEKQAQLDEWLSQQ